MWQTVKRFFIFRSKALEFGYKTWKSRRAIKQAYREGYTANRLFSRVRSHTRSIAFFLALAAVIAAGFRIGPPAVGYVTRAYTNARTEAAARRAARERMAQEAQRQAAAKAVATMKEVVEKPIPPPDTSAIHHGETHVAAERRAVLPAESLALREQMNYCILANKANKIVYLLAKGGDGAWSVAERFPAIMGRNDGQKQTAGDRRTPEGIYFIVGRKEKAELNPLYGPLAYVLNYPNEDDRSAGRTGQGIWIHGMPEDSSRMVTHGCIVMQNVLLNSLERYLKLGVGTPVVIVDKKDLVAPEAYPDFGRIAQKRNAIVHEYSQREQDFKQLLFGWKTAWASRNIDAYSRFYDPQRFSSSGMTWNAWRERKKNIFASFDSIEVLVDNIRLVDCSESTAVVVFRQFYEAAMQPAKQNAKRLCFYLNGTHWLIYREETFSTEEFLL